MRFVDDYTASVEVPGMGRRLAVSSAPLRRGTGDGKEPVELTLQEQSGGHEPENPLTALRLPERADGDVSLGRAGVHVRLETPGGTASSEASRVDPERLVYPEVDTDTDHVLAPTVGGFESFVQLRSQDSPETVDYRFSLPAGATLRASSTGGAEVVRDGTRIARVGQPVATDAQGRDVPVAVAVEGDRLRLTVRHRDEDFAMPILVDPIFEDYWTSGNNWYAGEGLDRLASDWFFVETVPGSLVARTACDPAVAGSCYGSGRGLQIYAPPGNYAAGQWGAWVYATQPGRTTYIAEAHYGWLWHNRRGDAANDSNAIGWLWNSSTASFTGLNVLSTPVAGGYMAVRWGDGGGVAADGPGTDSTSFALQMPTAASRGDWTDVYAGGAFIYLDDPEAPNLAAPTHDEDLSRWHGDDEQITTSLSATDPGLGVKYFNLGKDYAEFDSAVDQRARDCAGTRSSPCATDWTQPLTYSTTQMKEGANSLYALAYDPAVHASNGHGWSVKVDRSRPDVTLSGGLWDARGEALDPGQYALRVDASDGSASSPRSGVRSIEIKVDGATVSGPSPESCPDGQCPYTLGRDWTFDTNDFPSGTRTVEVIVTDLLGHTNMQSFVVSRLQARQAGSDPPAQPPETVITSGPSATVSVRHALFEFSSSDPDASFECKLDGGYWAACTSTKPYASLDSRSHTFSVRSLTSEAIDPSPATHSWVTDHYTPDGPSDQPSLSADGKFVAFRSSAIDFTACDANDRDDIIVYNLPDSGPPTVMERASVSSTGAAANEDSSSPSISSTGRYVAFRSASTNLVSGDTNDVEDIFLRDRVYGTTTRISVSTGEVQANGRSYSPAVSADGRYVAFSSDASNLVEGDTNGLEDVFVRDRVRGTTTRVSVNDSNGSPNGYSTSPSMSSDARYIAFDSTASNLVSGDTNGATDVFVRDLEADTTSRSSKSSSGAQGPLYSRRPSISADGTIVAFESLSSFHGQDTNSRSDIYVRDRVAHTTSWISNGCCYEDNGRSHQPSVSANGRYVAYASDAPLSPTDNNGVRDVYEVDRELHVGGQISADDTIDVIGNAPSDQPSTSNVRTVAFSSSSTNFSTCFPSRCSDNNLVEDVFTHQWVPVTVNDPTAALKPAAAPDCVGWGTPDRDPSSSITANFIPGEECEIRPVVPRIPVPPPPWLPDFDQEEPELGSEGYQPPPPNRPPPKAPDRCEIDDPPAGDRHHIATNKSKKRRSKHVDPQGNETTGPPWTELFKNNVFDKADLSMNDPANIVRLPNHKRAAHPHKYHQEVYERLKGVVEDLAGPNASKAQLRDAIRDELAKIAADLLDPTSDLGKLVTKENPECPRP